VEEILTGMSTIPKRKIAQADSFATDRNGCLAVHRKKSGGRT
jgi:hypothetical protein